jgi:Icc-related predicted phosphoesterase
MKGGVEMTRGIRTLLVVGQIRGEVEPLAEALGRHEELGVDGVVAVGDLGAPWSKPDTYREIFRTLGESGLRTFWLPGANDAPLHAYLREAHNMEIAFPLLRGVHATVVQAPGQLVFSGMGGEILDDPEAIRGEETLLRYPGWEVEYRLKVLNEFKERQKVFLFTTSPAHKGLHEPGSEVLAELIKTYKPRLVVVGRDGGASEMRIAKTLVISPGRMDQGQYALVDLRELTVEAVTPSPQATV